MNFKDLFLFRVILRMVNWFGLDPRNHSPFRNFISFWNFFFMLWMFLANSYNIIFQFSGAKSLEDMCLLAFFLNTTAKNAWWRLKSKKLNQLFDLMSEIWPMDKFGDEELKKYKKTHDFILKVVTFCSSFFFTCGLGVLFIPYYNHELIAPGNYGCNQNNDSCYWPVYIVQSFICITSFVIGESLYDNFFIANATYVYIITEQLKSALRRWSQIPETEKSDFLKEIIEEHVRILKFVKILEELYAEIFFLQTMAGIYNMVFVLYMLTLNSFPTLDTILGYGLNYVGCYIQVGTLCLSGNVISEQMLSIADEAYYTKWYNHSSKYSKALSMMTMKAQMPETLKAGYIIDINIITFTNVVTNSFKMCAAIQTIAGITK